MYREKYYTAEMLDMYIAKRRVKGQPTKWGKLLPVIP